MPKYIKLFEAFVNEATDLYVLNPTEPPTSSQGLTWNEYPGGALKYAKLQLGRLWAIIDATAVETSRTNFFATVNSADPATIASLLSIGGFKSAKDYQGTMPDQPSDYSYKARIQFGIMPSEIAKIDTIAQILNGTYTGSAGTAGSAGTSGQILGKEFDAAFQNLKASTGLKNMESFRVVINLTPQEQAMFYNAQFKSKAVTALDTLTSLEKDNKRNTPEHAKAAQEWEAVKNEWLKLSGSSAGTSGSAGSAGTTGSAGTAGTSGK